MTRYFWLRDTHRHPIACIAYGDGDSQPPDSTFWGFSVLHQGTTWSQKNHKPGPEKFDPKLGRVVPTNQPPDPFNRKLGREIAAGRLDKSPRQARGGLLGVLHQLVCAEDMPLRVRQAAASALVYLKDQKLKAIARRARLGPEDYRAMAEGRQPIPADLTPGEQAALKAAVEAHG